MCRFVLFALVILSSLLVLSSSFDNDKKSKKQLEEEKRAAEFQEYLKRSESVDELLQELNFRMVDTSNVFQVMEVDSPAHFIGGEAEMYKFLRANIKYPPIARECNVQGKVVLKFIVDVDGAICNPTIIKGVGAGLNHESIRILRLMPKWSPAVKNGNPVKTYYILPVHFKLM